MLTLVIYLLWGSAAASAGSVITKSASCVITTRIGETTEDDRQARLPRMLAASSEGKDVES